MSMTIYNGSSERYERQQKNNDTNNFNDLVLEHIKTNQPDGSLQQLLDEMREFSPETPITIQKFNSALSYSDTTLQNDSDNIDYTTEILDERTTQPLGIKMFIQAMLMNILNHNNEDEDLTTI